MFIWVSGHWPAERNRFDGEESFENAQANQEALKDSILDASEASVNDGDGDRIHPILVDRMRVIPRCPITTTDAYG